MDSSVESYLIFVYVILIGVGMMMILNAFKSWLLNNSETAGIKFWVGSVLLLAGLLIAFLCKLHK